MHDASFPTDEWSPQRHATRRGLLTYISRREIHQACVRALCAPLRAPRTPPTRSSVRLGCSQLGDQSGALDPRQLRTQFAEESFLLALVMVLEESADRAGLPGGW